MTVRDIFDLRMNYLQIILLRNIIYKYQFSMVIRKYIILNLHSSTSNNQIWKFLDRKLKEKDAWKRNHTLFRMRRRVLLNDDGVCWQERAELLLLRYASRWARHFVRRRLDLVIDSQERDRGITGLSVPPRHCVSARCPCQFIEDHLKHKPRGKLTLRKFFLMPDFTRWLPWRLISLFKKSTLESLSTLNILEKEPALVSLTFQTI